MDRGRAAARNVRRLREQAGQGTVEYVALMLLVVAVMGAVITAGSGTNGKQIADKVTTQIGKAVEEVGPKGGPKR
jgi:hypothetical protein